MFSPSTAQVVILFYTAFLAVGGIVGCFKAGSKPLLIAGFGGAVASIETFGFTLFSPLHGLLIEAALAAVLAVFFLFNCRRVLLATRRLMPSKFPALPSGILALLSLLVMSHLLIAAAG